jgi:hypothetical protein
MGKRHQLNDSATDRRCMWCNEVFSSGPFVFLPHEGHVVEEASGTLRPADHGDRSIPKCTAR